MGSELPPQIRRFILTSIDSVPHLEAVLLLRYDPSVAWNAKALAQQLYISEKKASDVLADLRSAGFAAIKDDEGPQYVYQPVSSELRDLMSQLSEVYAKDLVGVTRLIHSKISKQAQQFGDAFKWQDDKDS